MQVPKKRRARSIWSALRPVIGLVLLGIAVWWIRDSSLFSRISALLLVVATMSASLTILASALTMHHIARSYERSLCLRDALRVGALGTLGNSLGGMPIGTTIKYVVLHRVAGLSVTQITVGLLAFTASLAICFLLVGGLSLYQIAGVPESYRLPLVGTAIAVPVSTWALLRFAIARIPAARHLLPLLTGPQLPRFVAVSVIVSLAYLFHLVVIALFLLPQPTLTHAVMIAAFGILFGQSSLLQSLGGIQEFMMGLSAHISGLSAGDGIEIALVARASSIVSSALLVALLPTRAGDARTNETGHAANGVQPMDVGSTNSPARSKLNE